MNNKIYVYENESGDKGFIIASSYDKANKLYHEEYPRRRIIERDEILEDACAYLYEFDGLETEKLYNIFPV